MADEIESLNVDTTADPWQLWSDDIHYSIDLPDDAHSDGSVRVLGAYQNRETGIVSVLTWNYERDGLRVFENEILGDLDGGWSSRLVSPREILSWLSTQF